MPEIGQNLSHYSITGKTDKGGMVEVFSAGRRGGPVENQHRHELAGRTEAARAGKVIRDWENRDVNSSSETSPSSLADPLPDEEARKSLPTKTHALVQAIAGRAAFPAGQLAMGRPAGNRSAYLFEICIA